MCLKKCKNYNYHLESLTTKDSFLTNPIISEIYITSILKYLIVLYVAFIQNYIILCYNHCIIYFLVKPSL